MNSHNEFVVGKKYKSSGNKNFLWQCVGFTTKEEAILQVTDGNNPPFVVDNLALWSEHREPREFWIINSPNFSFKNKSDAEYAASYSNSGIIRVREILDE